jgi:hypothetical protein
MFSQAKKEKKADNSDEPLLGSSDDGDDEVANVHIRSATPVVHHFGEIGD